MSIILDHVSYYYDKENPDKKALDDVSIQIPDGQFVGLIGHTGSGKSTLIQHLNGLIAPSEGTVYYNGHDIHAKEYDRRQLRTRVGLVFQYPEHQLFEMNVFKDVCYGPQNQGLDQKTVELRAYEALKLVGLEDEYFYQPPFELSGGQKRRVAIAGVLAMKPDVLVLDEPTAGLDPKGRDEILDQIEKLKNETGITVVLVSHSMEDVARYVERLVVMDGGKIMYDDTPRNVFAYCDELEKMGLAAPQVTYIMRDLKAAGFLVRSDAISVDEAADEIEKLFRS